MRANYCLLKGRAEMPISRRNFFCGTAATALSLTATKSMSANCVMPTQARQAAFTPQGAVNELMEGNARFLSGRPIKCDMHRLVLKTSTGQFPFAAVVSCIDSRVAAEMVFDQNNGDIFEARVAGNFVNTDILGSLEFACRVAGARAIVVMGHTECGAIKGAVDQVELGNLTEMLERIEPAVQAAGPVDVRTSSNREFVQKVADANVMLTVEAINKNSSVLADMVDSGELIIVGAMYDIATGKVNLIT